MTSEPCSVGGPFSLVIGSFLCQSTRETPPSFGEQSRKSPAAERESEKERVRERLSDTLSLTRARRRLAGNSGTSDKILSLMT
ncbi:hypothetical protein KOW79_000233 [Hemibagrus wyckioides]|uniref:Uncharacterized protein n=1 Tax=Hemibagrus wyckioides TaxID=337641 RepID=A0A9D3SUK6_9TELE|nr:hypothetical protein KOW79_000233 [Hemibagrus wyckioides]